MTSTQHFDAQLVFAHRRLGVRYLVRHRNGNQADAKQVEAQELTRPRRVVKLNMLPHKAHVYEERAPVDVHPLSVCTEDSPQITRVDSPPSPVPLPEPPACIKAAFEDVEHAIWQDIAASLPNHSKMVHHWLDAQDNTARAVLYIMSRALERLVLEPSDRVEATLRQAMDEELHDSQHVFSNEPFEIEKEPFRVLEWIVALAHATAPRSPSTGSETGTASPNEEESHCSSEEPSGRDRLMELKPMVPLESCPPPLAPRHESASDLDRNNPIFVDHYGFLYGVSVTDYWRQAQETPESTQDTPSPDPSPSPSATSPVMKLGLVESVPQTRMTMSSSLTLPHPTPTLETSVISAMSDKHHGNAVSSTVPRLVRHVHDMYEEQEKERKAKWDEFLAHVHASSSSAMDSEPETIWHNMFVALRSSPDTARGQSDAHRFQALCEGGIPMTYRPAVWTECSHALSWAEPGRYADLHAQSNKESRQIALDVHRTMPTNLFFGGHGPGVPKLKRLLTAYAHFNVDYGYCQGMNNLAAVLLLAFTNEEDAFWVLVGTIHTILPPGYYAPDMLVPQADQKILTQLVRAGMPKLSTHMEQLGVELPAVTFSWFLSLFTACLPIQTVFRVWDMLFLEGNVILFRVAFAILSLKSKALLDTPTAASFYQQLHMATAYWYDADELVSTCLSMREKIRASDISARRAKLLKRLRDSFSQSVSTPP